MNHVSVSPTNEMGAFGACVIIASATSAKENQGKTMHTTHNRACVEMRENEFTARGRLKRIG